jgi:nucleotide-binding universal stress UspA family protein
MHEAAEFAAAVNLPLTVLHVARDEPSDAAKILDEARRYLEPYRITFSCETVTGAPHEAIVDAIQGRDFDLLFIGAYGHSRIIEMVLGSTTEYVLRNSPCPVFLAR